MEWPRIELEPTGMAAEHQTDHRSVAKFFFYKIWGPAEKKSVGAEKIIWKKSVDVKTDIEFDIHYMNNLPRSI